MVSFLSSLVKAEPILDGYVFDDWVFCRDSKNLCHGYYVEEPVRFPGQPAVLPEQPLTITAEQGQFIQSGDSTFKGHVRAEQGNRQLFADEAILHRNKDTDKTIDHLRFKGHVKLTEPGLRVDGTHGEFITKGELKVIYNAHFRLYTHNARGEANQITLRDKTRMILKNATYTTCSPLQNTWILKAKNVDFNKKSGRGRARHARLYFKDIPIFYAPYLDFPIDDRRQTGFLFPNFGITSRSGTEIGTPFYWNMAPNYDATITPKAYSKRGGELQGQFRYLTSNSQGEMEGAWLPNDKAYKKFRDTKLMDHPFMDNADPRLKALNKGDSRTAFRVKHNTTFNEQWNSNIHYQTVKDDNYFMDFGNTIGIASTNQLLQQGEVSYHNDAWIIFTRLQQYQSLHPFEGPANSEVYRKIPQIALQNVYSDLPFNFEWTTQADYTHFLHRPDQFNNPFTTGDRFWARPGLALPMQTPGWFLKPRAQWDLLAYSLSLNKNDAVAQKLHSPHRTLPIYDIDSGLIFERELRYQKEPYIQTLEPRLYYLYVPYRSQNSLPIFDTGYSNFDFNQLYRENRFSGFDRLGDANQLTFGLSTRLLPESSGIEKLSFTVGQIVYFNERKVGLCSSTNSTCLDIENPLRKKRYSAFVGQLRYLLRDFWTANADLEWDPYQKQTDRETFSVQYQPNEMSVLNFGYQFLRRNPARIDPKTQLYERLKQTDTSIAWPLNEQWRLLGRWHYDLHHRLSNDLSLGLEQQGCCTAVRLLVTRFLMPYDNLRPMQQRRYQNGIFLQFVFKGFAGVGHRDLEPTLKRAIPGYQWRESSF